MALLHSSDRKCKHYQDVHCARDYDDVPQP